MTSEHLEKLNAAKRKRAADAEKAIRRQVKRAWSLISEWDRDKITYIHAQLDSDRRDDSDKAFLRVVRRDILRPYIQKEAIPS